MSKILFTLHPTDGWLGRQFFSKAELSPENIKPLKIDIHVCISDTIVVRGVSILTYLYPSRYVAKVLWVLEVFDCYVLYTHEDLFCPHGEAKG